MTLGMTVADLERRMGASELDEWVKFYGMEPFGPQRDNIHAGLVAATIANAYRKKGSRAITFEDFMLVDPAVHKKKKTKETIAWMKAVGKKRGN